MNQSTAPVIETERLVLRPATTGDLRAWGDLIFADPDVIRFMPRRDMTPYARAERANNNYNDLEVVYYSLRRDQFKPGDSLFRVNEIAS